MAQSFTITGITDRIVPDTLGGFKSVVIVAYSIPEGYRGSVEVDKNGITPEKVQAAVLKDSSTYKAILAMKG